MVVVVTYRQPSAPSSSSSSSCKPPCSSVSRVPVHHRRAHVVASSTQSSGLQGGAGGGAEELERKRVVAKQALRDAIGIHGRGADVSAEGKSVVEKLAQECESVNPTPKPLEEAALLSGRWRLLYTTARGVNDAVLEPMSSSLVAVQFKQFKIGGFIPITAPPSARGSLDITYLDEELRISRGDKGNLFVLERKDP